jgi:hypothetical protein
LRSYPLPIEAETFSPGSAAKGFRARTQPSLSLCLNSSLPAREYGREQGRAWIRGINPSDINVDWRRPHPPRAQIEGVGLDSGRLAQDEAGAKFGRRQSRW